MSCLKIAEEYNIESIVFCSISTGIYAYPITKACKIALKAVDDYFVNNLSNIKKVIFNVFKKEEYDVYNREIKRDDF